MSAAGERLRKWCADNAPGQRRDTELVLREAMCVALKSVLDPAYAWHTPYGAGVQVERIRSLLAELRGEK